MCHFKMIHSCMIWPNKEQESFSISRRLSSNHSPCLWSILDSLFKSTQRSKTCPPFKWGHNSCLLACYGCLWNLIMAMSPALDFSLWISRAVTSSWISDKKPHMPSVCPETGSIEFKFIKAHAKEFGRGSELQSWVPSVFSIFCICIQCAEL